MAQGFALSDNTFQSNGGPSFPAHLFLIAGYSDGRPRIRIRFRGAATAARRNRFGWSIRSRGSEMRPFVRVSTTSQIPLTLADELDAAGLSWRYYAAKKAPTNFGRNWSAFDAIASVRYGPDWSNVINPERKF